MKDLVMLIRNKALPKKWQKYKMILIYITQLEMQILKDNKTNLQQL